MGAGEATGHGAGGGEPPASARDEPVRVVNLATGAVLVYVGCPPRAAVVAAHAQGRGDWNTWDYAARYDGLVRAVAGRWLALGDCVVARGREDGETGGRDDVGDQSQA